MSFTTVVYRVAPSAQALSGPFSSVGYKSAPQSRPSSCLEAAHVADRPKTDRNRTAGTHGRHRGLYAIRHLAPTTASPILDRLGRPIALSRSSPGQFEHRRRVVALLHHRMDLAEEVSTHLRPTLRPADSAEVLREVSTRDSSRKARLAISVVRITSISVPFSAPTHGPPGVRLTKETPKYRSAGRSPARSTVSSCPTATFASTPPPKNM